MGELDIGQVPPAWRQVFVEHGASNDDTWLKRVLQYAAPDAVSYFRAYYGLLGEAKADVEEISQRTGRPPQAIAIALNRVTRGLLTRLDSESYEQSRRLAALIRHDQGWNTYLPKKTTGISNGNGAFVIDECPDDSLWLYRILKFFTPRQRTALILYYGFCGSPRHGLPDVAKHCQLTERKTAIALRHGTLRLLEELDPLEGSDAESVRSLMRSDQCWRYFY